MFNTKLMYVMLQRQDQKRSDLDEQLKEYINEWRKQRAKEEDELKRLKEKQAKRKVTTTFNEKHHVQPQNIFQNFSHLLKDFRKQHSQLHLSGSVMHQSSNVLI